MKSERAKKYIDNDTIEVRNGDRMVDASTAYIAIDLAEEDAEGRVRAELTRWHDPKEDMPEEDTVVLCKVNYCKYTQYLVLNWYNGRWWFYIPYSASNVFDSDNDAWREFNGEVVGWREIGE